MGVRLRVAARSSVSKFGVAVGKQLESVGRSLIAWSKRLFRERYIWFEGPFRSWEEAQSSAKGYGLDEIAERVLNSVIQARSDSFNFERDGLVLPGNGQDGALIAALNLARASSGTPIQVLDFGGGLGSTFWSHREIVEEIGLVKWTVIEQDSFLRVSRKLPSIPKLYFEAGDSIPSEHSPNLVILGSVLQYLESPEKVLSSLLGLRPQVLFLGRHPVSNARERIPLVQHVPRRINESDYPMWLFPKDETTRWLASSYRLAFATSLPESGPRNRLVPGILWRTEIWVRSS